MKNAGIIQANTATFVGLGVPHQLRTTVGVYRDFFAITAMAAMGYRSAVILGMILVSVIGWISGCRLHWRRVRAALRRTRADAIGHCSRADISMLSVVLTLLLVDVFDTAGTLVGVATRGNMMDAAGRLPRLGRALSQTPALPQSAHYWAMSSTTCLSKAPLGRERWAHRP